QMRARNIGREVRTANIKAESTAPADQLDARHSDTQGLDSSPIIRLYSYHLVPTEGAFMGRLKAGTTGAAASEMRCRKSWSRPGRKSWPGRCGGRTPGVTPSATRRPKPQISRRTGRAPPGAFGDGIVQRQPTARCPLAHTA